MRKLIAAALSLAVLAGVLAQVTAYASVEGYVDGGYTVDGITYPLMKGVFHSQADLPMRFFYTDGFFSEDPYTYNYHLATTSLSMAIAGMYTETGEYSTRNRNIIQFMKDIGTANYHLNAYNTMRPTMDSIGVTIGWKPLSNDRILIPISVRGENYEQEWASNVTIGSGKDTNGESKGFSDSAAIVYNELMEYMKAQDADSLNSDGTLNAGKKFIFWIAGYSRGAAVSNLTAKRLADLCQDTQSKVYAYCFACPIGGSVTAEKSGVNYGCIHNVIDLGDIAANFISKKMDDAFTRYGVDHSIPGSALREINGRSDNDDYYNNEAKYNEALALMKIQLNAIAPDSKPELISSMIDTYGLDFSRIPLLLANNAASSLAGSSNNTDNNFADQVIDALIRAGTKDTRASFIKGFADNFFEWTGLSRDAYVGLDTTKVYNKFQNGSMESALRNILSIVYSCTKEQADEFSKRLENLASNVGVAEIATTFFFVFVWEKWTAMDDAARNMYTNKIIGWLEDTKCFDALGLTDAEKNKLVNVDMRVVLNFLITYLTEDLGHGLYNTSGLTQVLTLMHNGGAIKQNHFSNLAMAWVRAEDSLYANETSRVTASYVDAESEEYALIKASASGERVLININEPEYITSAYVDDPVALLNTRMYARAVYAGGAGEELPVTWDTTNFESYYLSRGFNENNEVYYTADPWVSYGHYGSELIDKGSMRLFVFNGKVTLPDNVTNPYNVSTDLTLAMIVDGMPKEKAPSVLPGDGEYYRRTPESP